MPLEIKAISSAQTLPIRQEAMWPNKPLEFVRLNNDEKGRHFGLFINDKLVTVISLFVEHEEAQFRKFATLPEFQGKGYGSQLLAMVLDEVQQEDCIKVWCNARVNKVGYYNRFGLKETAKTFEKEGVEYVVMEAIFKEN